jgi:hypothetical protein
MGNIIGCVQKLQFRKMRADDELRRSREVALSRLVSRSDISLKISYKNSEIFDIALKISYKNSDISDVALKISYKNSEESGISLKISYKNSDRSLNQF